MKHILHIALILLFLSAAVILGGCVFMPEDSSSRLSIPAGESESMEALTGVWNRSARSLTLYPNGTFTDTDAETAARVPGTWSADADTLWLLYAHYDDSPLFSFTVTPDFDTLVPVFPESLEPFGCGMDAVFENLEFESIDGSGGIDGTWISADTSAASSVRLSVDSSSFLLRAKAAETAGGAADAGTDTAADTETAATLEWLGVRSGTSFIVTSVRFESSYTLDTAGDSGSELACGGVLTYTRTGSQQAE